MRIIRLSARDMTEAVRRLKQELGPEAVILSTRKLPEGGVELTAALEPEQDEGPCSPGAGLGELEQRIDALARRLEGQLRWQRPWRGLPCARRWDLCGQR